jgi:hypothetical protein
MLSVRFSSSDVDEKVTMGGTDYQSELERRKKKRDELMCVVGLTVTHNSSSRSLC